MTAVASLDIYSARPPAVPLPDQGFVLPAENPVPAPPHRGLRPRCPSTQGTGSLRERPLAVPSPARDCLILHHAGKILSSYRSNEMGWTIDRCLPSRASPGPRGRGHWAGWGHWERCPPHPSFWVSAPPVPPPTGADRALGKWHRGWDFQWYFPTHIGGIMWGRRLGTLLPGKGCHRALKQFVSGIA